MLLASRQRILERLPHDALVVDVGGWADPFERADWVVDVMPYATRGLYERRGWAEPRERLPERFGPSTWIERDICERTPLPFEDGTVDFVVCAQILEDVRDPLHVCRELQRIGKAGYVEVPSRLEELSWGVDGDFVGWAHHRWVIDVDDTGIEFVMKPHDLHSRPDCYFPAGFWPTLSEEERVQSLWWTDSFACSERVFIEEAATDRLLPELVSRTLAERGFEPARPHRLGALRRRLAGARR